jgi:hypothetical protein
VAERRTRVLEGELRHVESGRGDGFARLTGLLEFESDESDALTGAAVATGTEAADE